MLCYRRGRPESERAAILDEGAETHRSEDIAGPQGLCGMENLFLLSRSQNGPLFWGTCASSVDEARLGREKFGGIVSALPRPGAEEEIRELLETADHIIFTPTAQWEALQAAD